MGIWELLWGRLGVRAALQRRGTVWRYWSQLSFQLVRPTSRRNQGPSRQCLRATRGRVEGGQRAEVECGRRIHAQAVAFEDDAASTVAP
jgi:hypothetical protein